MEGKYLHSAVLAVVLSILLLVVPPWTVTVVNAKQQQRTAACAELEEAAKRWRTALSSELNDLISASVGVAGFITAGAQGIPNHTGTLAERMSEMVRPDMFGLFASDLLTRYPDLYSLQILPSAVVSQVYPAGTGRIGLDLLNLPAAREDVLSAIQRADVSIGGPLTLSSGQFAIVALYPVFLGLPRAMATWWGAAACLMPVPQFLNATGISSLPSKGYHFLLERTNQTAGAAVLIAGSNATLDKSLAVHMQVSLPDGTFWDLYLAPAADMVGAVTWVDILPIAVVAGMASALGATLVLLAHRFHRCHWRDTSAAPVRAPLAILFTDIEGSTDLWNAHPDAMGTALTQHNAIIRKLIKSHGAYEVKTVGDSFMIACKTTTIALDLALDAMAALQNADWPPELEQQYGVPWLKVRAGVHLCTDVQCIYDKVSHGYDYVGNDVNKAARIVAKANGDEVYVSEAVQKAVSGLPQYHFEPAGLHQLRGIETPEELFLLELRPLSPPRRTPSHSPRRSISVVPTTSMGPRRTSEAPVTELVRTAMEMTYDADERQLTEWVLLSRRFLKLAMNPLKSDRKEQLLRELCEGWGLAPPAHTCDQLSFRLAHILQQRYPTLFSHCKLGFSDVQLSNPEFDATLDNVTRDTLPNVCPTAHSLLPASAHAAPPPLHSVWAALPRSPVGTRCGGKLDSPANLKEV